MTLGMRPREGGWKTAGRGGTVAVAAKIAASGLFALLFSFLLAGCGGGGGSSISGGKSSPTPPPGNVTVTGNVQDQFAGAAASNVVVAFGKYYALSGAGGNFSLTIPSGTSGSLIVYGKYTTDSNGNPVIGSNGLPVSTGYYYDTGLYAGSYISLGSTGIPIAATAANQTVALGTITLLSTAGPPPPPLGF